MESGRQITTRKTPPTIMTDGGRVSNLISLGSFGGPLGPNVGHQDLVLQFRRVGLVGQPLGILIGRQVRVDTPAHTRAPKRARARVCGDIGDDCKRDQKVSGWRPRFGISIKVAAEAKHGFSHAHLTNIKIKNPQNKKRTFVA